MDEESSFNAALDANPDDHVTRLVFADWLQERDDPRAEGYRALGLRQIAPSYGSIHDEETWWLGDESTPDLVIVKFQPAWKHYGSLLSEDWFALLSGRKQFMCWWEFDTRRESEDAAATAFAKLPPERRAELLNLSVLA